MEKPESPFDQSDDWLLRNWKAGDEQSAEILFDRYAMRLVALVAKRLSNRFLCSVDPQDVVQSALGSFFEAARHSRIEISQNVSLWRLLAVFARRKLARTIERQVASKRGGDKIKIAYDHSCEPLTKSNESLDNPENELRKLLRITLSDEQHALCEQLFAGASQAEIAAEFGWSQRTVRRRISEIREILSAEIWPEKPEQATRNQIPLSLERIGYEKFVLGKMIGCGGFGKVYRAQMQESNDTVVVKFLKKAFWQSTTAASSFIAEIESASKLNHRNIINYIGFGESPHGGLYIVSEWIGGIAMKTINNVTQQRFFKWLMQICDALICIHKNGLVHGDLTPSNVIVDSSDRAVIIDFGFSGNLSCQKRHTFGGTLGFAAPEQIDSAFGSISEKTDLYALGGIIYWYLNGQPPNDGDGQAAMLTKTLSEAGMFSDKITHRSDDLGRKILIEIMCATLQQSPSQRNITLEGIITRLRSIAHNIYRPSSKFLPKNDMRNRSR